jgi:osmotically-inducible protein OsmY
MPRSRSVLGRLLLLSIGFAAPGAAIPAHAQNPPSSSTSTPSLPRPEVAVLQALRANPLTAPYPIATSWRGGKVVLSGVVGTKTIHDAAVRTAIAIGYPVGDDLKIDTAAAHRVAAATAAASGTMPSALGGNPYYVYPPPLFGRLDDPFYGFEPPILSYPPWWRAVAAREPIMLPSQPAANASANPAAPGAGAAAPGAYSIPLGPAGKDGAVEMTLDGRGVAVLRGTVRSLSDRVALGQKLAQTPGISEVINELNVGPVSSDTPPPPPQPAVPGPKRPDAPAPDPNAGGEFHPGAAVAVDRNDLTDRLTQAIAHRPALAGLPIKVSVRDGVASLSGRVPTVYEAMLAFRAAQQTPGVHHVDDRLEFAVPDGVRKNPLLEKGRPEDVEPYLAAQIRRQVGDAAHIDQVRLQGETVEVRGTLLRADDQPRIEAILRSMPVLRDFRLEPIFVAD